MLFLTLVGLTTVTRLIELNISRRHRRRLFRDGAVDTPDPGFALMVSLHVGILLCSLLEVLLLGRGIGFGWGAAAALGVLLANALRIWTIRTLGQHWNVRVVDSTSLGIVSSGPYRFIRHPNYVAVFAELLLLPLVHGAWLTALCGAVLHSFVLQRRISVEEEMLMRDREYREVMGAKPRFFPSRWPDGSAAFD